MAACRCYEGGYYTTCPVHREPKGRATTYHAKEIQDVLDTVRAVDDNLRLKITHNGVETKWLSVSPEQVRQIQAILDTEGD